MRDLAEGQEVNEVFLVRAHTRRQRRNGEPFLKLQLGDTTGAVEAVIWDEVEALAPICPTGSVVRILGRLSVDERYGAAVTVKRMRGPRRTSSTWPTSPRRRPGPTTRWRRTSRR